MAGLLGVSGGNYVSQLESGKKNPSPMLEVLLGHLERQAEKKTSEKLKEESRPYGAKPVRWIPILPWDRSPETMEEIRNRVIDVALGRVSVETPDEDAFAMRVKGDAMEPRFPEGATLVCSPAAGLQNECLVLAKPRNGTPLFRRYLMASGEKFRLVPYNPIYPTTEHDRSDFEWVVAVISVQVNTWDN